jgi:hypothetical protein
VEATYGLSGEDSHIRDLIYDTKPFRDQDLKYRFSNNITPPGYYSIGIINPWKYNEYNIFNET